MLSGVTDLCEAANQSTFYMNHTILCAENNERDRESLKLALRKVGLDEDLHLVEEGSDAIDYLRGADRFADRETFPTPRVVLLSLGLSDIPGLNVLKWIREQPEFDSVVVILVAAQGVVDVEKGYGLRANSFLKRPHRIEGWNRIARAIREYWFGLNLASSRRSSGAVALHAAA
jgi:CheY-like chemotaxis protein